MGFSRLANSSTGAWGFIIRDHTFSGMAHCHENLYIASASGSIKYAEPSLRRRMCSKPKSRFGEPSPILLEGNEGNANYEYNSSYAPFFDYIERGDWDHANECLATIHPDAVRVRIPEDGYTALHVAAREGYVHIVKELVLLMTQEDLEIIDNGGYTPLHKAVLNENVDVVKELLPLMRHKGLVVENNDGAIALHTAALKGNADILEWLVQSMTQEDLILKNNKGCTTLHIASGEGHVHIVKELLPLMTQDDLEITENEGYTALHNAVFKGNVEIVKELVPFMRQQGLIIKSTRGAIPIHTAAAHGNVDIVKELVPLMRQEGLELKDSEGYTALHTAAKEGHVDIVKELVSFMRAEALEIKDDEGYTAIGRVLLLSRRRGDEYSEGYVIEMLKCMVEKNNKILSIAFPPHNFFPVVEACVWLKLEMTHYLYSVTPLEVLTPPENGSQGSSLFQHCVRAKEFDIAWDLLSKCPMLAAALSVAGGCAPILVVSGMESAFFRVRQLRFWQKWIYDSIIIKPPADINVHDLSINVVDSEAHQVNQWGFISSVKIFSRRLSKGLLKLLGTKGLYEMKLTHVRKSEFIRCMGKATTIQAMDNLTLAEVCIVKKAIFEAVERGDVEFVTRLIKESPNLMHTFDERRMNIFQYAIKCRQEDIYCLIYGLDKEKRNEYSILVGNFNNTMLHTAGNLSPLSQLNHIQDASLQIQRELQWFKEVERVVPPGYHECRNGSDGLTPRELFHKNHKKLMDEAEISIKGIASSCTVIGALIVTIMFAAAFTVAGGNDDATGLPLLIKENLFMVFMVSDTISLVSSTTSVIIFLGILTSRYAATDYLKNLPTKMMIGLLTLFISIATMMTTFCSGLILMLHERYSWVAIPSIMVASIPVISFVWMLFPLLFQTFMSTYGPGIFNRKVKKWY